jgi:hypothetical protein
MRRWWFGALVSLIGCGSHVSAPADDDGAGAADGGGGGGGELPFGACTTDVPCGDLGVCVFPQGSCQAGTVGSCQTGFTCDGPPSGPLCGCDGEVVEGEYAVCEMWGSSQPYANAASCAQGTFACGPESCLRHIEICVVVVPGVQGDPSHTCEPVSEHAGWCSHGIGDCSCLDLVSLGCPEFDESCCAADADHQETVTIYLP